MIQRLLQRWVPEGERAFVTRWLLVALALHLVTAYFSVGYHSADEHFQILEFASYKLGRTPFETLAVEFGERMRPWLQPAISFAMAKGWLALGVGNPFVWALSCRMLGALLGWASLCGLVLCSYACWLKGAERAPARRFVVLASALLWFLPALHARTSSENLAASVFLLGLCVHELARERGEHLRWPGWLAGFLLGCAFEFRFQVGIMVAGFLAWLIFLPRIKPKAFIPLLGGIAIAFALGRAIDAWAYGEWVMSPWQYVRYNLVENKVNHYGTAPWWDVFRMSFTESWPFIGLGVSAATILAWIRRPGHALTWSLVPFFLVHESIPHKELRFFFPIASAAPVLLALALYPGAEKLLRFRPIRWSWRFLQANNAVALAVLAFLPFSRVVQFYEGVWNAIPADFRGKPGSFVLYVRDRDPFEVLGTPIHFYRPKELEVRRLSRWEDFESALQASDRPLYLFDNRFRLTDPPESIRSRCELEFRTLPGWVERANFTGWLDRTNVWALYRCK